MYVFVLNPFLLFAKMYLLRFSSQQGKKDGRRFYPAELLSRGNPLLAMSHKGVSPQGNFLHYNFLKAQCLLSIIPFSDSEWGVCKFIGQRSSSSLLNVSYQLISN